MVVVQARLQKTPLHLLLTSDSDGVCMTWRTESDAAATSRRHYFKFETECQHTDWRADET